MTSQSDLLTTAEIVHDLRTVILLAGSLGGNALADGVERSVLDLPVDAGTTVLDHWIQSLDRFACAFDFETVSLRIAVNQGGALPSVRPVPNSRRVVVEIVRDPAAYRGTAGIVKDLTRDYSDGDLVLVASANQIQREPIRDCFRALCRAEESVSIAPHGGGEFAGMFLLRCARLRDVPDVGFVDLKEQAIPSARGHRSLLVARRPRGSTLPIRTLLEYVRALREVHGGMDLGTPGGPTESAFAETWKPNFSIVEPGASVAPGAVLQDSVVLAGGVVEEGAAVVRSVVCGGGVVRRGRCVLESIVTR